MNGRWCGQQRRICRHDAAAASRAPPVCREGAVVAGSTVRRNEVMENANLSYSTRSCSESTTNQKMKINCRARRRCQKSEKKRCFAVRSASAGEERRVSRASAFTAMKDRQKAEANAVLLPRTSECAACCSSACAPLSVRLKIEKCPCPVATRPRRGCYEEGLPSPFHTAIQTRVGVLSRTFCESKRRKRSSMKMREV